jgi:hypothetical protein
LHYLCYFHLHSVFRCSNFFLVRRRVLLFSYLPCHKTASFFFFFLDLRYSGDITQRNIPEERRTHQHRGESLQSMPLFYFLQIIRGTLYCARLFQHHHMVCLCDSYYHLVEEFGVNWLFLPFTSSTFPNQYSRHNYDGKKKSLTIDLYTKWHQVKQRTEHMREDNVIRQNLFKPNPVL